MILTKRVDLPILTQELGVAGVPIQVGTYVDPEQQTILHTWDPTSGQLTDVPPEAVPVVDAHVAPPLVIDYAGSTQVAAIVRTTDAAPHEVFRFPCALKSLYQASLIITGIDAGNFVSRVQEGRFTWKRTTGNAVVVGVTVVSNLGEAASSSWAPNFGPQGTEIVFTVQGAAGRTIDWMLVGSVSQYTPEGLT